MVDRKKIATREYLDAEGEGTRSPNAGTVALKFTFANDHVLTVDGAGIPEALFVPSVAAWHGLSQKIGDSFAAAKGDIEGAIENAGSMLEQLVAGDWTSASEAGPRISLVLEAIANCIKSNEGDDAWTTMRENDAREALKSKDTREGALKDPVIRAEYEGIKANRAVARAKEAKAAAKGEQVSMSF